MAHHQLDFADQYEAFVEKFRHKKTSDDCYTPDNVYDAIRDYVCARFGYRTDDIVRPFWPGADYTNSEYPDGCLVLDNPPFSKFTQIVRFYVKNQINFFIFGPSLTILAGGMDGATALITGSRITYKNGARVMTGFAHNLTPEVIAEACPELDDIIKRENDKNLRAKGKVMRKLALPDAVITAARMQYFAYHSTPYRVMRRDAVFIRKLDALPSGIFGAGLLLSERAAVERAAVERAAAEHIPLSDREKEIQRMIKNER